MAVEIEKALKYPLNFKPLFMLGMLFFIVLISLFIPSIFFSKDVLTGTASDGIFSPIILYSIFFVTTLVLLFTFFNGYMVSVSRSIIAGNNTKAPEIKDVGKIFIDGIKYMFISLAYTIVPVLFLILAVMTTYLLIAAVSRPLAEVVTLLLLFLYLFLLYPLFFVFHIAGAHFVRTGSVRKALNIPYIYSLVFGNIKAYTIDFFIYFIVTLVYSIAIMVLVTYPFVLVASYVAGQYIFTMFYLESTGFIAEPEKPAAPS